MRNMNPLARQPTQTALDAKTNEVAKAHGCDRGTFTVCWGEHEQGLVCVCKEEARRLLSGEQQ